MEKNEILSSKNSRRIALYPNETRLVNTEVLGTRILFRNQEDQNVTSFTYWGVKRFKNEKNPACLGKHFGVKSEHR